MVSIYLILLLHSRTVTSLLCNSTLTPTLTLTLTLTQTQSLSPSPSFPLQTFSFRSSFSSKTKNSKQQEQEQEEADKVGNEAKNKNKKINNSSSESSVRDSDYPSGEFQLQEFSWWRKLTVKLKMLTALPRERIPNATIFEQLESRYSSELSLPQICENIIKAAYDPRKFIVAYVPECCEEEYCLACACEEIYAPPSAYFSLFGLTELSQKWKGLANTKVLGINLPAKLFSEENCEMLIALLDNVYEKWLYKVSSAKGKSREDLENFINQGVYQVGKLKEEGWITNKRYDDEVISMLRERLGLYKDEQIPMVDYREYSRVRKWTLRLSGGEDQIAVIRASGSISRVRSLFSDSSSDIIEDNFIEKIRSVRESKRYKAAIIRIDSPGGDALASDLMWREIKLLAASKPVIASMSDVAASGGYYMAMAAGTIVAENLTFTGSIGVGKIGFNKEIISRGKCAELHAAEQRPLRSDEAELLAKYAQHAYKQFRNKAAFSRSMPIRWRRLHKGGFGLRLVVAIGGLSRAVAMAKLKANIRLDRQVILVELSKPSPTLSELLSGLGNTLVGVDRTLKELLQGLIFSDGVQARMNGIMFQ
ncbi:serine protease sppa [Quercus suber]|uniref:Serine protease sppa n=1 Tax=Quercus suber TaxID=58331 RepID=A0AAW0KCK6_QUESU